MSWTRRFLPTLLGLIHLSATAIEGQRPALPPLQWITQDTTAIDMWAYWAPDGRITFSRSTDRGATWRLLVTDRTGGTLRPFLSDSAIASATRGSWSRRHNRFAFTGGTRGDDTTAIWWTNAAGKDLTRIPARGVSTHLLYPSWTSDGRSVVVLDYGAAGGNTLLRIDVTSGAAIPLTQPAQLLAGMPTVSADGDWIAFAGQQNHGGKYDQTRNQIWLLPASGAPREISGGQGRQPDWSPDGQWIAFTSSRGDSTGRHAVFIVAREGGTPAQLTDYATNAQHPVWSPDGHWLIFSAQLPATAPAFGVAMIAVPATYSP